MAPTVNPAVTDRISSIEDVASLPAAAMTHAQRADIIHAAMTRAGRYAARCLGSASGSTVFSCRADSEGGADLAPGVPMHQGHFLDADVTDGEGSDLE